MLSLFNKYLHGYLVTPCYVALENQGVFQFLQSPRSLEEIVNNFKANFGHLRVALRVFESLNWIANNEYGQFLVTQNFPVKLASSGQINSLYVISLDPYLSAVSNSSLNQFFHQLNLTKWLPFIEARWHTSNERLADFFDSAVMLPLLYLLKNKFITTEDKIDFMQIPKSNQTELLHLFSIMRFGQLENGYFRFSELGQIIWNSILNAGMVLSYQPMLAEIENLIFGNVEQVFHSSKYESHINRGLNVLGSGRQHQLFFVDFQEYLRSYIESLLPNARPDTIVDMGCGDGSLLKDCYDTINQKTDVTMIGVDFNLAALQVASLTLKDTPHKVIQGDIGNPTQLQSDLAKIGIKNKNGILHIRSFLDHDRFYLPPKVSKALENRKTFPYAGIYVDHQGNLLPNAEVIQSLVEHFKKWSEIISPQGMISLEVFCLPPEIVMRYLDETESLHFDAIHSFSKQLLVEADVYLLCAAESGLFTTQKGFKKYPTILPYTRISRQHFFKRPYSIRHSNINDLEVLIAIEKETTPAHLRSSEDQLVFRLNQYPQGQYVMEIEGQIVGILYTQRIEKIDKLYEMKYENMEDYHELSGQVVQLLGLYIAIKHQGSGLSNDLLEFGLIHNFARSGVRKICGISRCFNYKNNFSLEKYIKSRNSLGYIKDPILRIHDQMGAEIVSLVPNFRDKDLENQGAGVHIEYTFNKWQRRS